MCRLVAALAFGVMGAGWIVGCSDTVSSASTAKDAGGARWNPDLQDGASSSSHEETPGQDGSRFDASAQRFCTTLVPPAGVVDLFCADFDGANARDGFTSWTVPSGGELTQTTDLAYSPPASFMNAKNATLYWEKAGTKAFSEIDLKFRLHVRTISPPANKSGNVTIIELGAGNTKTSVRYARGAKVDGTANYVGYYLESGATQKKIPTAPDTDVWTQIHLLWSKNGFVELYYDDDPIYAAAFSAVTANTVWLTMGLVANGDAPEIAPHAFDDVVVAVKRD